jgi:transglutaminase-like putative cysteine protease
VIDGLVSAIASGSLDPGSIPLVDPKQVAWERVSRSTYLIDQELRYRYEGPIRDLRHRLVVIPPDVHGDQRRVDHRVAVEAPPDSRVTTRRDTHGNVVVDIAAERVEAEIGFRVVIAVTRRPGSPSHLAPRSHVDRYRVPSSLTAASAELEAAARSLRRVCGTDLSLAHAINEWVHATMAYGFGVTHVGTTAAEALAGRRGVCQDHAHVMLALCRICDLPARYVSGHLLGEGGTHAWVEVFVADAAGARAVALDPCNGCRVGANYLTVATGRDYSDVAPTSGTYLGTARGHLTATKQVEVALGLTA